MFFFLQDQDGRGKDGERPKLERQESRLSSDSQDDSARESSSEGKSMFVCFYKILFAKFFSITYEGRALFIEWLSVYI